MKLAHNKDKLHRSFTIILSVLLLITSIIEFAKDDIMEAMHGLIPTEYFSVFTAVVSLLMIIARYIRQDGIQNTVDKITDVVCEDSEKQVSDETVLNNEPVPEKDK